MVVCLQRVNSDRCLLRRWDGVGGCHIIRRADNVPSKNSDGKVTGD